jgi:uncharacterized membrane protein YbhN (UPF0104 family)
VRLRRPNAVLLSVLAVAASIVAVIVLAIVSGVSLHRIFDRVDGSWLLVVTVAQAASYVPYMLAYRQLTAIAGLRPPTLATVIAVVLSGFGPFVVGGGFSLDREVMGKVYEDRHTAHTQVVGLIALEWIVLAPLAWLAAVALLVSGADAKASMLWPWALGVPIGLAVGLWLTAPDRNLSWLRRWTYLAGAIDGIRLIHTMLHKPFRTAPTWMSMAVYWVAEIVALYAALRLFGSHLSPLRVTVAYGTGYILTRRSLPLAGAVITEVVLTFALHWLGAPLGPALAAVTVYRLFNLILISGPALLASRHVHPEIVIQ